MKPGQLFLVIILGVVAVLAVNTLFIVRETEQAMVLAFGKIESLVAEPGLSAVAPGSGLIRMPPVSVCHQVSTIGQRPSPTTL